MTGEIFLFCTTIFMVLLLTGDEDESCCFLSGDLRGEREDLFQIFSSVWRGTFVQLFIAVFRARE